MDIMANIAAMSKKKLKDASPWIGPSIRTSQRDSADASCVTATQAKNEFGSILERVIRGDKIFITKHDNLKAVLMSMDEFEALSQGATIRLNTLSDEFDELLARMQSPGARSKMQTAFEASPKQLGKAALKAAQKRG